MPAPHLVDVMVHEVHWCIGLHTPKSYGASRERYLYEKRWINLARGALRDLGEALVAIGGGSNTKSKESR